MNIKESIIEMIEISIRNIKGKITFAELRDSLSPLIEAPFPVLNTEIFKLLLIIEIRNPPLRKHLEPFFGEPELDIQDFKWISLVQVT